MMNRKELIKHISEVNKVTKADAGLWLNAVVEVMVNALKDKSKEVREVKFDLGRLCVCRARRTPYCKEPGLTVRFRPSKSLKADLKKTLAVSLADVVNTNGKMSQKSA